MEAGPEDPAADIVLVSTKSKHLWPARCLSRSRKLYQLFNKTSDQIIVEDAQVSQFVYDVNNALQSNNCELLTAYNKAYQLLKSET